MPAPAITHAFAPGTRGWCVAVACALEASAPKPGNVHPTVDYHDLSHRELVTAGAAIAPHLDVAPHRPLGATILAAVEASRQVTRSNANLGIVLAIAPLAAVPDGARPTPEAVSQVLAALRPADARDCWRAIAVARPGGMGARDRWDLAAEPPPDLLAAMRAAAGHDQIARLWAHGYHPLFSGLVADLDRDVSAGHDLDDAIVRGFLRQLAREPDSLIARKHGPVVAAAVSDRARAVIERGSADWRAATRLLEEDLWEGRGLVGYEPPPGGTRPGTINPGTTADLVAAALYVLLATGRLQELVPTDRFTSTPG
ncbi:MAG: triphosphoribosyl-dephospho-CoA synthase [Planctomycetia bacterium]